MNRETIIETYNYCENRSDCICDVCPYYIYGYPRCRELLFGDAISLLKAQEPKMVKEMLVVGGHLMGKCPRCSKILTIQDHPVACGFCGQGVKWK